MMQETEVRRHVPQKDFYSVSDAASLLQISKNKVYELANRGLDPLPFRRLTDMRRGMFVSRPEFADWVRRNSILIAFQGAKQGGEDAQGR